MALEEYTLQTLREQIKSEFGIDPSDTQNDREIEEKVNQAQDDILREGPWTFQLKPFTVNCPDSGASTLTLAKGSASGSSLVAVSGTALAAYDVLFVGASVSGQDGFLVTAVSGTSVTLDAEYPTTGGSGLSVVHAPMYYPLPTDCKSVHFLWDTSTAFEKIEPSSPYAFMLYKLRNVPSLGSPLKYTVVQDPLSTTTRKYLSTYPYITTRTVLRGLYFIEPQKMTDNSDIPLIPRDHRTVLFKKACELFGTSKNDGRVGKYTEQAIIGLMALKSEYLLQDDPDVEGNDELPFPTFKDSYPELI